jgi:hypothetical protein
MAGMTTGDSEDPAGEAGADLPTGSPAPGGSARELLALLLMGIGGVMVPLLAPAVGVMLMPTTSRWTPRHVRTTWFILAIGGFALVAGLVLLALADPSSAAAARAGLLMLGVAVVAGPASALYAATRPRPAV